MAAHHVLKKRVNRVQGSSRAATCQNQTAVNRPNHDPFGRQSFHREVQLDHLSRLWSHSNHGHLFLASGRDLETTAGHPRQVCRQFVSSVSNRRSSIFCDENGHAGF